RYALPVKVVANAPLRVPADALIELVVCPGFGATDDGIAAQARAGDVVITADVPPGRALSGFGRPRSRPEGAVLHGQRHRRRAGHAGADGGVAAEWCCDGRAVADGAQGPLALPREAGRDRQRRAPRQPSSVTPPRQISRPVLACRDVLQPPGTTSETSHAPAL